jgi:hypothetical protein
MFLWRRSLNSKTKRAVHRSGFTLAITLRMFTKWHQNRLRDVYRHNVGFRTGCVKCLGIRQVAHKQIPGHLAPVSLVWIRRLSMTAWQRRVCTATRGWMTLSLQCHLRMLSGLLASAIGSLPFFWHMAPRFWANVSCCENIKTPFRNRKI